MTSLAVSQTGEDEALLEVGAELLALPLDELDAYLGRLDPEALDVAERAMAAIAATGWRSSPSAMANHLDPRVFRRWRYVEFLSRKFVDAVEGRSTRQIWNLPGRYGKSLLASQWGPVWAIDRTGGLAKIILVSYGYDLAMENAVGVRDRLVAHSDVLRGQLKPDRRRQDRFVTEAGGGVLASGIDGSITGFGAGDGGGVVLDDPFKNWQQAHSAARRDYVENQFKGTIRNRLDQEEAWIIVVHHRVHEDDITARLMADVAADEGDDWELIALPALARANDPIGREPGEALEPEKFTKEACEKRARGMGTYLASGLEQQDPTPEEGNELLRAWFVLAEAGELPSKPDRAITSWDLKLKNREAGDFVVGQCWWRVGAANWCMDQIRGRYDHATTGNAIALLAVRHPEAKEHVIEAAGSSDEVIPELRKAIADYEVSDEMATRLGMNEAERAAVQELRRSGMGHLRPEPPIGDKSIRARTWIAPAAEAGNVRLPADAPWVPAWLDEHASFPEGANDDQVDADSQALKRLGKRKKMQGATAADETLPAGDGSRTDSIPRS